MVQDPTVTRSPSAAAATSFAWAPALSCQGAYNKVLCRLISLFNGSTGSRMWMTRSLSCLAPVILSLCGWLAKCLVLSSQTWGMTRLDTRCIASGAVEPFLFQRWDSPGFHQNSRRLEERCCVALHHAGPRRTKLSAAAYGCRRADGWCRVRCFGPWRFLIAANWAFELPLRWCCG